MGIILFILQCSIQTKTSSVSKPFIDDLFVFMDRNFTNLSFHKQLYNQIKHEIFAQHQTQKQIKNKRKNTLAMRKLFQILNGFSKQSIESMNKMHELEYNLLPLCVP